jgi:S-adenosylmethionine:tRNA-ribosyltransferase-isomerase (queuine synthetase)
MAFRRTGALLTNLHLPRTSLLLVCVLLARNTRSSRTGAR